MGPARCSASGEVAEEPFERWEIGETVAWRGVACRVVRQLGRRDPSGYVMLMLEEISVPDSFHTVSSRYVYKDKKG